MSFVRCPVSGVLCPVNGVGFFLIFFFFSFYTVVVLVGEGSVINGPTLSSFSECLVFIMSRDLKGQTVI